MNKRMPIRRLRRIRAYFSAVFSRALVVLYIRRYNPRCVQNSVKMGEEVETPFSPAQPKAAAPEGLPKRQAWYQYC